MKRLTPFGVEDSSPDLFRCSPESIWEANDKWPLPLVPPIRPMSLKSICRFSPPPAERISRHFRAKGANTRSLNSVVSRLFDNGISIRRLVLSPEWYNELMNDLVHDSKDTRKDFTKARHDESYVLSAGHKIRLSYCPSFHTSQVSVDLAGESSTLRRWQHGSNPATSRRPPARSGKR